MRGGRKGQEFPLEDGNNLVGRWDPETGSFPEVDLDADDPEAKISRKHALIRIEGGKITVEDIGSLNGTYVNRQPRLIAGKSGRDQDGRRSDYREDISQADGRTDLLSRCIPLRVALRRSTPRAAEVSARGHRCRKSP